MNTKTANWLLRPSCPSRPNDFSFAETRFAHFQVVSCRFQRLPENPTNLYNYPLSFNKTLFRKHRNAYQLLRLNQRAILRPNRNRQRLGAPPARPRRRDFYRPARPRRHRPSCDRPRHARSIQAGRFCPQRIRFEHHRPRAQPPRRHHQRQNGVRQNRNLGQRNRNPKPRRHAAVHD